MRPTRKSTRERVITVIALVLVISICFLFTVACCVSAVSAMLVIVLAAGFMSAALYRKLAACNILSPNTSPFKNIADSVSRV